MSAVKDQATSIVRTEVPEDERINFLPKHVGGYYLLLEQAMFNCASDICDGYEGGFWSYYELSNGGWYLAPDLGSRGNELDVVVASNGYSGQMTDDALGLVVTITIVNHLMWDIHLNDEPMARRLSDTYYLLRDYAAEHPEAAAIYGAID